MIATDSIEAPERPPCFEPETASSAAASDAPELETGREPLGAVVGKF